MAEPFRAADLPRLAPRRVLFLADFFADFLAVFRAEDLRAAFLPPFLADFFAALLLDFLADLLALAFLAVFLPGRAGWARAAGSL